MDHLRANGFQVEAQNVSDAQLNAVAIQGGVSDDLRSCHTAKVGGYTVEGHVPAADIKKMLAEKPAIAGIAVPGMPIGSPGMEQGGRKDPFDTIAFTKDGKKTVYARHR
ncbi:MAG: DUF411 domain-containing protein [Vicinamibacterales bacterium]